MKVDAGEEKKEGEKARKGGAVRSPESGFSCTVCLHAGEPAVQERARSPLVGLLFRVLRIDIFNENSEGSSAPRR